MPARSSTFMTARFRTECGHRDRSPFPIPSRTLARRHFAETQRLGRLAVELGLYRGESALGGDRLGLAVEPGRDPVADPEVAGAHGGDLPLERGGPVRRERPERVRVDVGGRALERVEVLPRRGPLGARGSGRRRSSAGSCRRSPARRSGGRTSRSGRPSSSSHWTVTAMLGIRSSPALRTTTRIIELSASFWRSGNAASSTATGNSPSGSSLSWRSPLAVVPPQPDDGQRKRRSRSCAHARALLRWAAKARANIPRRPR